MESAIKEDINNIMDAETHLLNLSQMHDRYTKFQRRSFKRSKRCGPCEPGHYEEQLCVAKNAMITEYRNAAKRKEALQCQYDEEKQHQCCLQDVICKLGGCAQMYGERNELQLARVELMMALERSLFLGDKLWANLKDAESHAARWAILVREMSGINIDEEKGDDVFDCDFKSPTKPIDCCRPFCCPPQVQDQ